MNLFTYIYNVIRKICTKCGIEKGLDEFTKTYRTRDGHYGYCKECGNKVSNKRYHDIKNGCHIKREKTKCDGTYFENIDTEEKSYWLGFLYADGYVRRRHEGGQLKLKLNVKDKNHIEKFKNSIKSDAEIKDGIEFFTKDNRKYESKFSVINIYSLKIVNDLTNLGCVECKTASKFKG